MLILVIRFFLPLIYSVFSICTYSLLFKKSILKSAAPAFFIQILMIIATSMLANSFSVGIIVYLFMCCVSLIILLVKNRSISFIIEHFLAKENAIGILWFLLLYMFIYISNYGKVFQDWDEFSHWGIFVKEMFRLDRLYCTSTAEMAHKDYVPAISVFETLWCKLSLRYSEADAYRGIQMLQASMMIPLIEIGETIKNKYFKVLALILKIVMIFTIPMYVGNFYHTIYQDLIFGILIFYCVYVIIEDNSEKYKFFLLTLSLSILILSKMAAIIFLPTLILLYIIWERIDKKKVYVKAFFSAVISLIGWYLFNKYVDFFIPVKGGQSYDDIGNYFVSFLSVILHNAGITYQTLAERRFISALFTSKVGYLPYLPLLLSVALVLYFIAKKQEDRQLTKKILLINLWILLTGIYYAAVMLYLYLTAFSEYEAKLLASYSRYMGTFILATLMTLLVVMLKYVLDERFIFIVSCVTCENLLFLNTNQLLPGTITGETKLYNSEAEAILRNAEDTDSVYVVACYSSGEEGTILRYRCSPMKVEFGSPGEKRWDTDVYSHNYSSEEFATYLEQFDFIYLYDIDDIFIEQYSDIFVNWNIVKNHVLYGLEKDGEKYRLLETK